MNPQKDEYSYWYSYSYPRLVSGGVRPKDGSGKDYAAWLISEYYRYVEIAVFIPYSILLSLPVYSFYSLVYLIRTAWQREVFVLNADYVGFCDVDPGFGLCVDGGMAGLLVAASRRTDVQRVGKGPTLGDRGPPGLCC